MNLETAPIHFSREIFATFVVVLFRSEDMGKNSPNMSHTKSRTGIFFIIDCATVKTSRSLANLRFRRDRL